MAHRALKMYAVTTALAVLTQICPELVSRPFDDYAKDAGLPSKLKTEFNTKNIRVYNRDNPLDAFHMVGQGVIDDFNAGKNLNGAFDAVISPFSAIMDLVQMVFTPGAGAFAYADQAKGASTVYFYPQSNQLPLREWVHEALDFDMASKKMHFNADTTKMAKLMSEFVILHELRHTEQADSLSTEIKESDADVFAAKAIRTSGIVDTAGFGETVLQMENLRAINALKNEGDHATSMALENNDAAIADKCSKAFKTLAKIVNHLDDGDVKFNDKASDAEKSYYLVKGLLAKKLLDRDALVKRAAVSYVNACEYFNRTCETPVINRQPDLKSVNFEKTRDKYLPAPAKPAAKARALVR